jgi:multicomponent Na+:H+ antiporter subunit F
LFDYARAVEYLLLFGMSFLALTIFFCLFFAVRGPRLTDKIIATNMIAVKTIILVVLTALYLNEGYIVDIAILFALICFLCTFVFTRLILQFIYSKPEDAGADYDAGSADVDGSDL